MVSDKPESGKSVRSAFLAYNAVLAASSPLLLGWFGWRLFGSGKSKEGWLERLGFASEAHRQIIPGENIWVHAVSVGEVAAAAPVVKAYSAMSEAFNVEVSTITSTGAQMARKLLPDCPHFFLPVDILPAVRAVMKRVRPRCLVLCEVEIWPNLLNEARRTGAEVILINGRVSDSTLAKAKRFGWIFQWSLGNVSRFLMQSQEDADRIISLGAPEQNVIVAGNTKFDEADEPLDASARITLTKDYGLEEGCPVFVAGSTNPGEDEPVLDAFVIARKKEPTLRLIIAPRQIERAEEICKMAEDRHLTAITRKEISGEHNADVIVLNTFGELARVYSLARVAFVGGTLIDKGGHNILQPLVHGVPVVFGPYDYKIRDIAGRALDAGCAFRAEDAGEFNSLVAALAKGDQQHDLRTRALKMIEENRGASQKCAEIIHQLSRPSGPQVTG